MCEPREVSAEELSKHKDEKDCWLIVHGKVYDVSGYLVDHPGGVDVMMEFAGKDATEEFEYYGHSNKARQQMKEFEIGVFEGRDASPVEAAQVTYGLATPKRKSLPIKIVQSLLPLLVIALAFIIKTYWDGQAA